MVQSHFSISMSISVFRYCVKPKKLGLLKKKPNIPHRIDKYDEKMAINQQQLTSEIFIVNDFLLITHKMLFVLYFHPTSHPCWFKFQKNDF